MTSRVGAQEEPVVFEYVNELAYTWIDNESEVVYAMRFLDPVNLTETINNIYMSGNSLYISPNPVIVHSLYSMENNINYNEVWTGIYGHVLWWEYNKVYSNNVTLIAWKDNEVTSWNDNATILWWMGNIFRLSKNGWVPMVILGWSGNVMWTGHDGNVLVWWKNNKIWENTSRVYVFWWEENEVADDASNVMIWWSKVIVSGVNNVFVFSNFPGSEGYFRPLSSNAFYLNLSKGVWLGVDSNYLGLAVSGAVRFGVIDPKLGHYCNEDNLGVVWSYWPCLVWCTDPSKDGKWMLLDIGYDCIRWCETESYCYVGDFWWSSSSCGVDDPDDGLWAWNWGGGISFPRRNNVGWSNVFTSANNWMVIHHLTWTFLTGKVVVRWGDEPYGHCTTWVVNVANASKCGGTGAEILYSNSVVFETSLIDSDEDCPTASWENKCVYKCNSGYSLVAVSTPYKYECKSDCVMNWEDADSERFKFNEETVWFEYGEVNCADEGECSTYKKVLRCWSDWKMHVEGGNGTAVADWYYKSCEMKSYRCDSGYYNLLATDISSLYGDTIDTLNLVDGWEVVWMRWIYDVCIDYNWTGESTCTEGKQHFRFNRCNESSYKYSASDGKCMKQCQFSGNNFVQHGMVKKFYKSWNVECPNTCNGQDFRCNDWTWESPWLNINDYKYYECSPEPKLCDTGVYNVGLQIYNSWSKYWQYESCNSIFPGNGSCNIMRRDYKLTNCNPWFHTENGLRCVGDVLSRPCIGSLGKPENSEWINGTGWYTESWSWEWNTWYWIDNSNFACQWKCSDGYWNNNWKCEEISRECESTHYNCVDSHASVSDIWDDIAWYYWKCQGKQCRECKSGYHLTGEACAKDIPWQCNNDEKYGCIAWTKHERGEDDLQYNWECRWEPESAGVDYCHLCKTEKNAVWSDVDSKCVCKEWYSLSGDNCVSVTYPQPQCWSNVRDCEVWILSWYDSWTETWNCVEGSQSVKCWMLCDCPKGYRWNGKECELYLRVCAIPRTSVYVQKACSSNSSIIADSDILYGNDGKSPDSCCGVWWNEFEGLRFLNNISWWNSKFPEGGPRSKVCTIEKANLGIILKPKDGGYLQMFIVDDWINAGVDNYCDPSGSIDKILEDCYANLSPYTGQNDNWYTITACGDKVPEGKSCHCSVIEK